MRGHCIGQPADYRGLVNITVKGSQIVWIEWPDTSDDLSERIAFDRVDAAICVLPESSYCVIHDTFPPHPRLRATVGCDVYFRSSSFGNHYLRISVVL